VKLRLQRYAVAAFIRPQFSGYGEYRNGKGKDGGGSGIDERKGG
jgi:hypothetical protein